MTSIKIQTASDYRMQDQTSASATKEKKKASFPFHSTEIHVQENKSC